MSAVTEYENREAAFISKITASTTHEIRNVLAIVKESAGLIEDMVKASGKGRPLKHDRLIRAVNRIDAQVTRGADLLTNLNRFAHSLDHPTELIDVKVEVDRVAMLCERFARLRGHAVSVEHGRDGVSTEVNALLFHMSLCCAVDCCQDRLAEPGSVRLITGESGGDVAITLRAEAPSTHTPPSPRAAPGWEKLQGLVGELGGRVEASTDECHLNVLLPAGRVPGKPHQESRIP